MLFFDDSTDRLYNELALLEDKLAKSESERKSLECRFLQLKKASKTEGSHRLNAARQQYAEFVNECKQRSLRNESILKSLRKVEVGANAVFAKTERLKQLRMHYDAYLNRVIPLWRHPYYSHFQPILQLPDHVRHSRRQSLSNRRTLLADTSNQWSSRPRFTMSARERLESALAEIESLGLAGERMIAELDKVEPCPERPARISEKVMKPMIPEPLKLIKSEVMEREPAISVPEIVPFSPPPPSPMEEMSESARRAWGKIKENPELLRESFKEFFEIECLATDSICPEEEQNLSDDEVVNSFMTKCEVGRDAEPPRKTVQSRESVERQNTRSPQQQDISRNQYSLRERNPTSEQREKCNPITQRSVMAHQKSIEELKAMLSFEEDDTTQNQTGMATEDEVVPEEFNEEFSRDYDVRIDGDYTRKVILEEDEPEEVEGERFGDDRYKRKDWGRVRYNREQLESARGVPNLTNSYGTPRSSPSGNSPLNQASKPESTPTSKSPYSSPKTTADNRLSFKSATLKLNSPLVSPISSQSPLHKGRTSPLQRSGSQHLLQKNTTSNSPGQSPIQSRINSPSERGSFRRTDSNDALQGPNISSLPSRSSPQQSSSVNSPSHPPQMKEDSDTGWSRKGSMQREFSEDQYEDEGGKAGDSVDYAFSQNEPNWNDGGHPYETEQQNIDFGERYQNVEDQNAPVIDNSSNYEQYATGNEESYEQDLRYPTGDGNNYEQDLNYYQNSDRGVHYEENSNFQDNHFEPYEEQSDNHQRVQDGVEQYDQSRIYEQFPNSDHPPELPNSGELTRQDSDNQEIQNQYYQHPGYEGFETREGETEEENLPMQYEHQQYEQYEETPNETYPNTSYEPTNQYDNSAEHMEQVYHPEQESELYEETKYQPEPEFYEETKYQAEPEFYEGPSEQNNPNYFNEADANENYSSEPQPEYQEHFNVQPDVSLMADSHRVEASNDMAASNNLQPAKSSLLSQLLDSDSESYQVEPANQNQDDSDFDFSVGK